MRRYTYLWLLQLVTGVLIAVLLGIHMALQHLDKILTFFGINLNDPTSWNSMIERSKQTTWAGIYIALLAVLLYHGLNGLRNVILELTPSARTERVVTGAILAFGILAFIWASYVPIALLYQ
jgi:succinate dehydrogenase / fumarate reductase membrane anchor subunit